MTDVLAAMEEATVALYAANAGRGGCTLREEGGVRSAWAPSASPALNVVLGGPRSARSDVIRATIAHAAGRPFLWKVLPRDPDRDALVAALLAAGLVEVEPSTAIVGPIPDGLDALRAHLPAARPVRSVADFERWLVPFLAAFHLPPSDADVLRAVAAETDLGPDAPVQHVLVEAEDRPVACGTLVLEHPTLAAAFNVAVAPDARRGGFGSAVLGALAATARGRGRAHLGQFSTPAGLPLYRPWGQVLAPPVRNLLHPGAA